MLEEQLKKQISIEQELNQVAYKGISFGETIGFFNKKYPEFKIKNPFKKRTFMQWLSVLTKLRFQKFSATKTDVLFIHYSQRQKDWGILDGVEEQMKEGIGIKRYFATAFVQQYSLKDLFSWARFWIVHGKRTNRELKMILEKHNINKETICFLINYLITSSLYLEACTRKLKKLNPSIILFTYDRDKFSSIVTASANSLGIKTTTIIHGSCFHTPLEYIPFISKEILIWGSLHIDHLTKFGVNLKQMHIVGFPGFKKDNGKRAVLKKRFGIGENKKVVLFAANLDNYFESELKAFMEETKNINSWTGVVKLHPTLFSKPLPLVLQNPEETVVLPEECTAYESVILADVVVGLTSTLLMEALSADRPVIIYNPCKNPRKGIGEFLLEFGFVSEAISNGELKKILESSNHFQDPFNLEKQKIFFQKICSFQDHDSEKEIIEFLMKNL